MSTSPSSSSAESPGVLVLGDSSHTQELCRRLTKTDPSPPDATTPPGISATYEDPQGFKFHILSTTEEVPFDTSYSFESSGVPLSTWSMADALMICFAMVGSDCRRMFSHLRGVLLDSVISFFLEKGPDERPDFGVGSPSDGLVAPGDIERFPVIVMVGVVPRRPLHHLAVGVDAPGSLVEEVTISELKQLSKLKFSKSLSADDNKLIGTFVKVDFRQFGESDDMDAASGFGFAIRRGILGLLRLRKRKVESRLTSHSLRTSFSFSVPKLTSPLRRKNRVTWAIPMKFRFKGKKKKNRSILPENVLEPEQAGFAPPRRENIANLRSRPEKSIPPPPPHLRHLVRSRSVGGGGPTMASTAVTRVRKEEPEKRMSEVMPSLRELVLRDSPASASSPGLSAMVVNIANSDPPLKERYPMHYAAFTGNYFGVRLLMRTCNMNGSDESGRTVLHCAVLCQEHSIRKKVVQYLLRRSWLWTDRVDSQGLTPLAMASILGYSTIIRMLLISGRANPNRELVIDGKSYLPRDLAGASFTAGACFLDFQHRCRVFGEYVQGREIEKVRESIFEIDTNCPFRRRAETFTPLEMALEQENNEEVVQLLLDHRAQIPKDFLTRFPSYQKILIEGKNRIERDREAEQIVFWLKEYADRLHALINQVINPLLTDLEELIPDEHASFREVLVKKFMSLVELHEAQQGFIEKLNETLPLLPFWSFEEVDLAEETNLCGWFDHDRFLEVFRFEFPNENYEVYSREMPQNLDDIDASVFPRLVGRIRRHCSESIPVTDPAQAFAIPLREVSTLIMGFEKFASLFRQDFRRYANAMIAFESLTACMGVMNEGNVLDSSMSPERILEEKYQLKPSGAHCLCWRVEEFDFVDRIGPFAASSPTNREVDVFILDDSVLFGIDGSLETYSVDDSKIVFRWWDESLRVTVYPLTSSKPVLDRHVGMRTWKSPPFKSWYEILHRHGTSVYSEDLKKLHPLSSGVPWMHIPLFHEEKNVACHLVRDERKRAEERMLRVGCEISRKQMEIVLLRREMVRLRQYLRSSELAQEEEEEGEEEFSIGAGTAGADDDLSTDVEAARSGEDEDTATDGGDEELVLIEVNEGAEPKETSPSEALLDVVPNESVVSLEDEPPLPEPVSLDSLVPLGCCHALYGFSSRDPEELSFEDGETITILKINDDGWHEGRIGYRHGLFPQNHTDFDAENIVPVPVTTSQDPAPKPKPELEHEVTSDDRLKQDPLNSEPPDASKDLPTAETVDPRVAKLLAAGGYTSGGGTRAPRAGYGAEDEARATDAAKAAEMRALYGDGMLGKYTRRHPRDGKEAEGES